MEIGLVVSIALNLVLAVALFFKSALNTIVVDWHKRFQEQRANRRQLLLDLHEHMGLFDARYLVVTGTALLTSAAEDLDAGQDTELAGVVRSVSAELDEKFSGPYQASLDFLHRRELELPARIRRLVVRLFEAMRVADADAITDPADVHRRTTAVRGIVEELRSEIRRAVT